jgi:hypothetical protein
VEIRLVILGIKKQNKICLLIAITILCVLVSGIVISVLIRTKTVSSNDIPIKVNDINYLVKIELPEQFKIVKVYKNIALSKDKNIWNVTKMKIDDPVSSIDSIRIYAVYRKSINKPRITKLKKGLSNYISLIWKDYPDYNNRTKLDELEKKIKTDEEIKVEYGKMIGQSVTVASPKSGRSIYFHTSYLYNTDNKIAFLVVFYGDDFIYEAHKNQIENLTKGISVAIEPR